MTRWWSDASTAAEKLELVDSSNPSMGMGVAVLGFHAVAKSALDPLARTTLHDQASLSRAYDEADFSPVIDAVHSALCGVMDHDTAVNYGRMVVSDWVSTSKDATTRLTTTLVNKGQPWPRAIARAAEVAGVPLRHLGRYASSAATPGLDQLSVADMADRALFEYAGRRAAMESDLVSKDGSARVRHRTEARVEEPWDESQVRRDELGRFAEEAKAAAEIKELREARKRRRARDSAAAAARASQAQETTTRTVVAPGTATRQQIGPGSVARQRVGPGEARTDTGSTPDHADSEAEDYPPQRDMDWLPRVSLDEVPPEGEGGYMTVDVPLYILQTPIASDDVDSFVNGLWGLAFTENDIDLLIDDVVEDPGVGFIVVHEVQAGDLIVKGRRQGSITKVTGYTFPAPGDEVVPNPVGDDFHVDLEMQPTSGSRTASIVADDEPKYLDAARRKRLHRVSAPKPSEPRGVLDPLVTEETNAYKVKPVPSSRGSIPVYYKRSKMITWTDSDLMKVDRVRIRTEQRVDEPWDESQVNRDELGRFAEEAKSAAEIKELREARRRRRERDAAQAQAVVQVAQQRERVAPGMLKRTQVAPGQQRAQVAPGQQRERTQATAVVEAPVELKERKTSMSKLVARWGSQYDPEPKVSLMNADAVHSSDLGIWDRLSTEHVVSLSETVGQQLTKLHESSPSDGFTADQHSMTAAYPGARDFSEARMLHVLHRFASEALIATKKGGVLLTGNDVWDDANAKADDLLVNELMVGGNLVGRARSGYEASDDRPRTWTMIAMILDGKMKVQRIPVSGHVSGKVMLIATPEVVENLRELYYLTAPDLKFLPGGQRESNEAERRLLVEAGMRDIPIKAATGKADRDYENVMAVVSAWLEDHPMFVEKMDDDIKLEVAEKVLTTKKAGAVRLDGIDVIRMH